MQTMPRGAGAPACRVEIRLDHFLRAAAERRDESRRGRLRVCATLGLTLLMQAPALYAQDRMAEALRKGIVEEDTNRNLNAAIQSYQAVLAQYDEDRKSAATALFRIAECYRKQGKSKEAIAAYSRVVRDFADEAKLAEQSRNQLSKTYGVAQPQAAAPDPAQAEARRRYREALQEGIQYAQQQVEFTHEQYQLGAVSELATYDPQALLARFQGRLAAFDAGLVPQSPAGPRTPEALAARAQYKASLQTQIDYAAKNVEAMQMDYKLGKIPLQGVANAQMKLVDARLEMAGLDAGLAIQPGPSAGLESGSDPEPSDSAIAQKMQQLDLRNKLQVDYAQASALEKKCKAEKKACEPVPALIAQLSSALHDLDAMQPGKLSDPIVFGAAFHTMLDANAALAKLEAEFQH